MCNYQNSTLAESCVLTRSYKICFQTIKWGSGEWKDHMLRCEGVKGCCSSESCTASLILKSPHYHRWGALEQRPHPSSVRCSSAAAQWQPDQAVVILGSEWMWVTVWLWTKHSWKREHRSQLHSGWSLKNCSKCCYYQHFSIEMFIYSHLSHLTPYGVRNVSLYCQEIALV